MFRIDKVDRFRIVSFFIFFISLPSGHLLAQSAGSLGYDSGDGRFEFHNGSTWVGTNNGDTANGCGTAGSMRYDSTNHRMEFCNGSTWRTMVGTDTTSGCPRPGSLNYNTSTNTFEVCLGSTNTWWSVSESGGSFQAILNTGISPANNGTGALSLSINKPIILNESGQVFIAVVAARGGTGQTISPPAGWIQIQHNFDGDLRVGSYYKIAGGSEPSSYSFTLSGSAKASGGILSFSGVDTSTPFLSTHITTAPNYGLTDDKVYCHGPTITSGDENTQRLCFFMHNKDESYTHVSAGGYDALVTGKHRLFEAKSTGGATTSRTYVIATSNFISSSGAQNPSQIQFGSTADNLGLMLALKRASSYPTNPCTGQSIGQACTGGGIYAGTFRGQEYMVVPGNCTDSATPTCNGGTDSVVKGWNGSSGTEVDIPTIPNVTVDTGIEYVHGDVLTNILVNHASVSSDSAADYCNNMVYGGFDDWFLPSKSEMAFLHCKSNTPNDPAYPQEDPNCASFGGKENLISGWSDYYWNSSEFDLYDGWNQHLANGAFFEYGKGDPNKMRCTRRF